MKMDLRNTQPSTALLCNAICVYAPETKSLCCAAAGIIDSVSATTEALIPHEKLREAATPGATLIAQNRPPAQPVVGYIHVYVIDGRKLSNKGLVMMLGNSVSRRPMMALIKANTENYENKLMEVAA